MKYLEQIRAANALNAAKTKFEGAEGGGIVKKVPTMIRENGLLGALAFAAEKKNGSYKNGDHHKVFEQIVIHLRNPDIALLTPTFEATTENLIKFVARESSSKLREITAETMAFLSYLRRFASGGDNDE